MVGTSDALKHTSILFIKFRYFHITEIMGYIITNMKKTANK